MIALSIDGVLRQPVGGGVMAVGNLLYRALVEIANVALVTNEQSAEQTEHWLKVNGFADHNYLVLRRPEDPEDAGQARVRQITRLREMGPVEALVEPDPAIAAEVIRTGTPVLLCAHPAYAQPEFLPGYKTTATSWDLLVAEIDRQRAVKAEDPRLEQETV